MISDDEAFDWAGITPSEEQIARGRGLVRDGLSFPDIHNEFTDEGASEGLATMIVEFLAKDTATKLLARGLKNPQVTTKLTDQGLSPEEADKALQTAVQERREAMLAAGAFSTGQTISLGVAGIMIIGGVALVALFYATGQYMGTLETGVGGETTGIIIHSRNDTYELEFEENKDLRQHAEKLKDLTVFVNGELETRKGADEQVRLIIRVTSLEEAQTPYAGVGLIGAGLALGLGVFMKRRFRR